MGGAPPLPQDFAPQGLKKGPKSGFFWGPRIRLLKGGQTGPGSEILEPAATLVTGPQSRQQEGDPADKGRWRPRGPLDGQVGQISMWTHGSGEQLMTDRASTERSEPADSLPPRWYIGGRS